MAMARRLAREEAIFVGTSTGANVLVALRLAERLGAGKTIVTILPESLRAFEQYRLVIFPLILIVMMLLRPHGILGQRELWDLLPRRRK